jgi:hypothetical protein
VSIVGGWNGAGNGESDQGMEGRKTKAKEEQNTENKM